MISENFEKFAYFADSVRFADSKRSVSTLVGTKRLVSQAGFSKLNNQFSTLRCRFDHGN